MPAPRPASASFKINKVQARMCVIPPKASESREGPKSGLKVCVA